MRWTSSTPPPPPDETPTALDVLVVDDNDVNVALMTKMVSRMGHHPAQAKNGLEAVALATARAFDIILMDVSMPVMDGREATGIIRANGLSARALIIGVTAFSDEARIADLTDAGMDIVLTKPVNTAELSAAINGALRARTQADTDTTGTDFDRALAALQEMLNHADALRFLGQALDDVTSLLPAMVDPDLPMSQIAGLIHAVVGSTAVVGLSQLSRDLAAAENAARADDRAQVHAQHGAIAQALAAERACHQAAIANQSLGG